MSDFSDWYNGIPQITRYWFTAATVVPLLGRFGLISAASMYLDWELFAHRFQVSAFNERFYVQMNVSYSYGDL